MDFGFGEDQELLRTTTRRFLTEHQSLAEVRRSLEEPELFDAGIWRQGADLGWTAMLVPAEYEGGELISYLGSETLRFKGKPGSAVFYPSTTIHEVTPVTAGERLVIITFIESQIPDQMQRDLLYTLREVRALEGLKMDWRNQIQLEYVIANLHRMWSR